MSESRISSLFVQGRMLIAVAALAACQGQPADRAAQSESGSRDSAVQGQTSERAPSSNSAGSAPVASARPAATGQWFSRDEPGGGWAGFGPPYSEAFFSARCESGRVIFNVLEMPPTGGGPTQMQLTAQGVSETVPAQASDEGLPNTDSPVAADAPWLAQLASASGNLSVTVGGGDALTVPIGEPLRALIRACAR